MYIYVTRKITSHGWLQNMGFAYEEASSLFFFFFWSQLLLKVIQTFLISTCPTQSHRLMPLSPSKLGKG